MTDDDTADTYAFAISATPDGGLDVRFGTRENFTVSANALAQASSWFGLAQHSTDDADDQRVPPFLLPRATLRALQQTGTARWQTLWSQNSILLSWVGTQRFQFTIDGKRGNKPVLHLAGAELQLIVLDDVDWPVVIALQEYDNAWRLAGAKAVGRLTNQTPTTAPSTAPSLTPSTSNAAFDMTQARAVAAKVGAANGKQRDKYIADFAKRQPLEAVFALLNHNDPALKGLARDVLRARSGDPSVRAAMHVHLQQLLEATKPAATSYAVTTVGDLQPEAVEHFRRLFGLVPKDFAAVAGLVREAALGHPCDYVRAECIKRALELDDHEVTRAAGKLVTHPEQHWRSIGLWAAGQSAFADASTLLSTLVTKATVQHEAGVDVLYQVLAALQLTDDADQWLGPVFMWRSWVPAALLRTDRRVDVALAKLVSATTTSPRTLEPAFVASLADAFCTSTSTDLNTNLNAFFGRHVQDPIAMGLLRCLASTVPGLPAFLEKTLATAPAAQLSALVEIIEAGRVAADDVARVLLRRKDTKAFKSIARALVEHGLDDEAVTAKLAALAK